MPLKSDRTTTSSAAGSGSGSPRSSPRPGSAIQNAHASPAVTRDTITFHPAQMISTDWQLPAAPLRASAVATVVAGFAGAITIAELARGVLPVGGIYAVKAGAIFSIVMLVALGFLPRHHPFARFGPANQVTTIRAMLVALIGARFDMEIDALLILVLAILVSEFDKAGPWVILSGLLRYIFVGAGRYWPRLRAPLFASRRRQAVCVVQILALNLAIVPAVQPPLSAAIAAVALAALAWSFLVDTRWLARRALARVRDRPARARRRQAAIDPAFTPGAALDLGGLGAALHRPLRGRHHPGALRPRHQLVLGRAVHAGCRG